MTRERRTQRVRGTPGDSGRSWKLANCKWESKIFKARLGESAEENKKTQTNGLAAITPILERNTLGLTSGAILRKSAKDAAYLCNDKLAAAT